ncbi:hypothetical protein D3C85_1940080 [compost metagenome]
MESLPFLLSPQLQLSLCPRLLAFLFSQVPNVPLLSSLVPVPLVGLSQALPIVVHGFG